MLQCFPYNQNKGANVMNSSPYVERSKAESDYALAQSRKEKIYKDNNSRLVILGMQPPPSDEEVLEDLEDSNQEIAPPRNRNLLSVDDYVQIPKIAFSRSLLSPNPRKNSEVNIKMEDSAVHALSSSRKQEGTEGHEIQSLDSERGDQWASWNLEKIKIIPHSNNFLEEEDMSLPLTMDKTKDKQKYGSKLNIPEEKKEKVKERQIVKERERRERERNIEMVSNFLSGKASVIWLFVLGLEIDEGDLKNIRAVYKDYIDNDYEVPLCRSYAEAQRFLSLQTCFFKVVADLESSQQLLQDSTLNKNIVAIYLYNPKAEAGITRTFQLKRSTRKIKGMFMDLKQIADLAREEIENEAKFIRVGDELERDRNKLRFPSFVMLSGADSSEITAYRLCLYGALKIKEKRERESYLKEFTDMVELRYAGVPKELDYLMDYKLINHTQENSEDKLRDILKFYVKETFYYALTNSILRLSRSSQEFRPCTIPFNETYQAIRHYYKKYLTETSRAFKKFITYRGAKLRNSDVKCLSIGSYIQLLGFTSTSLKKSQAEKFMDNDSYLIEIHVQTGAKDEKQLAYDHGFVEINRYGIAAEAFQNEQEVLFNALNVFKVTAMDLESAVRKITLSYGGIFELLRAKPNSLSPTAAAVLANYKYCIQTFESIEDDGDVLLLAHQHGKCVEYYQNRIDQGEKSYRTYGKLAFAQMQNGNLDEAYENALKSLSLVDSEPDIIKDTQKYRDQMASNAVVFEERQDYLHYEAVMKRCVNSNQDNWLAQAKLIKSRAEKRMRAGDLGGSKQDLQLSRDILSQKQASFEKRRKQIAKRYMFRSFCCCCSRTASQQLEEQKELELLKVEEDEVDFEHHKEEMNLLRVDIENLSKELAEQMGNRELFQKSKIAAQQHYSLLTKKDAQKDPIIEAKYHVLQAKVVKEESETQFESRMESAIELIKEHDHFHKDIGTYSKILGTERHANIKKKLQLAPLPKLLNSTEMKENVADGNYLPLQQSKASKQLLPETQKFDYFQHEKMYNKCKSSYSDAANNIAYNKGSDNSEYLQINNSIAELDYDYSFLQQSQKTARKNSQRKIALCHTEGSKCYLLLAKISLAKGELKNSFKEIIQSYQILRSALVKIDNKQYNQVLMNNPLYMDINLQKVKIFNRQLKHDLALKQLKILKKIAKIKIDHQHHSSLLATILEEQANILVCLGQTVNFEKYLLKAIKIRQQEMGQFNIPNAISYANLFKYLIALNDFEEAMAYHFKATEIFSRFSPDHPNAWVIHMSNGIILEQKKDYDQAIAQLEYCLKVATQKYSSNHINLLKIQFHFAKMLKKLAKPDLALQVFETLEAELSRHIGSSPIEKQTDDQKILLRRNLYRQMKDLYGSNEQNMMTMLAKQKCEKELKHYDEMFGSEEVLSRSIK